MDYSFFIFGMSQTQDLFPVLFESLKRNNSCWVCFFDCFTKKRQLANYNFDEIYHFFKKKCDMLNYKMPEISFFGINDEEKYLYEYNKFMPKTIFVQEIKPKYSFWYPKVQKKSKVIHFAWWDESKHLYNPEIKVNLTILKQEEDIKHGYENFNTKFLGNLRLDHLYYTKSSIRKKRCFIPETYLRMSSKYKNDSMKIVNFCNKLINFLKKNNFEVVWKKREKGFPKENWASPLDFCNEKPDIVIEKDLNFPSALIDYAYNSDICLVINDCFAFFDLDKVNTNCFILTTEGGRKNKIEDFFIKDYEDKIIDMKTNNCWNRLENKLKNKNNFVYNKKETLISTKILEYCKSIK